MTKEEIVDNLELYTVGRLKKDRVFITVEELQNLIDEIKALEQPTSDDCVSRAELKKWLDMNFSFGGAARKFELFDRLDKELSPVTPTRKKGKWIYNEKASDLDYYVYNCSICGRQINLLYDSHQIKNYPYCHCGAEMESEE